MSEQNPIASNELNDAKPLDFEAALKTLENLVKQLSQGQLSLEQALHTFEQGMALSKQCQQLLQAAEQKIQVLSAYQEPYTTQDFDPSSLSTQ